MLKHLNYSTGGGTPLLGKLSKVAFFVLLLFITTSALFASNLIWSWDSNDKSTKYFRYQIGGEEDWNVVDSSITSIKLKALPGLNTLYVAASSDGINWSDAEVGTYLNNIDRKFELSFSLMPYALQRIAYSDNHKPESRLSTYGVGVGIGFAYSINPIFAFGTDISSEHYRFKSFHNYFDFKGTVSGRFRLFEISNNRLYIKVGCGADLVLRDDNDYGCYPLLVYGIEDSIMLNDGLSIDFGCDFNHSFQKGSNLFHFIPFISITYHFGSEGGLR